MLSEGTTTEYFGWVHLPMYPGENKYFLGNVYSCNKEKELCLVKLTTNVNEKLDIFKEAKDFDFSDNNIIEVATSKDYKDPNTDILKKEKEYIIVNDSKIHLLSPVYHYNADSNNNKHWFDPFDIGKRYPYMKSKEHELRKGRIVYVSLPFTKYYRHLAHYYMDILRNSYDPKLFGEVLATIEDDKPSSDDVMLKEPWDRYLQNFCQKYSYNVEAYKKIRKVKISKEAKDEFKLEQDFYYVPYGAIKLIPAMVSTKNDLSEFDIDLIPPIQYQDTILCDDYKMLQVYESKKDPPNNYIRPSSPLELFSPSYDINIPIPPKNPSNKLVHNIGTIISSPALNPLVASTRISTDIYEPLASASYKPKYQDNPTTIKSDNDKWRWPPFRTSTQIVSIKKSEPITKQTSNILAKTNKPRLSARVGGYKPRKQLLHSKKPNNISRRRKSIKFKKSRKPHKYKKTTKKLQKNKKNKRT
jgi:hypothetical protein